MPYSGNTELELLEEAKARGKTIATLRRRIMILRVLRNEVERALGHGLECDLSNEECRHDGLVAELRRRGVSAQYMEDFCRIVDEPASVLTHAEGDLLWAVERYDEQRPDLSFSEWLVGAVMACRATRTGQQP